MADLKKTIEIIFAGVDEVSTTISDINSNINDFAGGLENATQPLADLASGIAKTEAAIAALGIATLAYALGEAVELTEAETGLQKVLGDSEGVVAQYTDTIKELALQFGESGQNVTDSATAFKQAGFTIEEALNLASVALTGVKIAELGADESSRLLIANIRGLGEEAGVATHLMDAWNEVSNRYAVTAGEVAEATARLAPIAKTAGLSFDELVGLATPLIEVLGSGAIAGTALRTSLANLITDIPDVTDTLDALGVSQLEANGELRLSGDILKDIGAKWATLSTSQQANFSLLLFGKEQYAKMNILLNDFSKTSEVTATAIDSQGSALEELAVKLSTALAAQERLSTAFTFAASTVGKQYIDSTTGITNSLAELIGAFDKTVADGGLAPLFDALNPLLDEFALTIDAIAKNLPAAFEGLDFSGLISSFREIGIEIGDLFGDGDLTTVEGLQDALQSLIDGFATLNDIFAGVVSGFAPVIDAFTSIAGGASDAEDGTAKFIGEIIGSGATINVFAGLLGGLTSAIGGLADAVIAIAGAKALGLLPTSFGATGKAAGLLVGKLGLLGAAFSAGFGIGNIIADNTQLDESLTDLFVSFDRLVGGPIGKAEDQMRKLAEQEKKASEDTKNLSGAITDLDDAATDAIVSADKYDDEVANMAESAEWAARVSKSAADSIKEVGEASDESADSVGNIGKTTAEASEGITSFGDAASGAELIMDKYGKVVGSTDQKSKELAETTTKLAKSQKEEKEELIRAEKAALDALKAYNALQLGLEEIASNERIKNLEFTVNLQTAQIEADAQKVVAAFDSISDSFAATENVLGGLFEQLGEAGSLRDQFAIEAAIKFQENLATQQWEKQSQLIDAQIARMEASTQRLNDGGALLTVDGGDLQPELQAVMESLFANIRIQMSAEYQDFLLGTGL